MTIVWERLLRPTAQVLGIVSAILCGALAVLLVVEVLLRGTGLSSIRGLFEIAELGLVMIVFLGLANSEVTGTHVRVTLLTDRLRPAVAARVRGVALLLAALFIGWMAWELSGRALESFASGEFRTGLLNFPVWPSRTFVAVGTVFLAVVLAAKGLIWLTGRTPSGTVATTEGGAV
jgi:TRAP-type C4-dicarboxylate transport system permease small subunit